MVGRACGHSDGTGIRPGTYCEPRMTSVGSQDTTGPMTRDELKDLACLGFSADLVMQSFCHTAAYPKLVDVKTHRTLPSFITARPLRPRHRPGPERPVDRRPRQIPRRRQHRSTFLRGDRRRKLRRFVRLDGAEWQRQ